MAPGPPDRAASGILCGPGNGGFAVSKLHSSSPKRATVRRRLPIRAPHRPGAAPLQPAARAATGARWRPAALLARGRAVGLALVAGPLLLAAAAPVADQADAIVGVWRTDPTDKGYAHIEVIHSDGRYEGRVIWLSEPDFPPGDPEAGRPKSDRLNPDPQLRGRPILGMSLMEGLRYEAGVWRDGRIYDPETGKTYRCNIRLADDGTLRLRGFIGVSLFGRSTVWSPVSS